MNHLTRTIFLEDGTHISQKRFAEQKAQEFTEKYSSIGITFTPGCIHKFIAICDREESWPEEQGEESMQAMEAICILLEKSRAIETSNSPETALEALPPEASSPETTEYLPPSLTTEELVLKGALETRLDNGGYSRLAEVYSFDEDMIDIRAKEGAIETPEHAGMLMGFGVDLGRRGIWLCIQGAQRLMARGMEGTMEQVCASLKLSPQSIYNYLGSLPYATPEVRKALPPTVLVELCRGRYSDDDTENDRIKKELVQEAVENGWNAAEARSHSRMAKGKDDPVEGKPMLREQLSELDREIARLKSQVIEWPELPVTRCSREDVIEGLREVYKGFLRAHQEKDPGSRGFPDAESILDYIEEFGLPPKGYELKCIPESTIVEQAA